MWSQALMNIYNTIHVVYLGVQPNMIIWDTFMSQL